MIEEADRDVDGCFIGEQATFWEDVPAQSKKTTAGEQVLSGRLSGRQEMEVVPISGRPVCTLYENCIAPLCPLDQSSLGGIWYPDEEICRSRTQGNPPWMKAQRKLSRVAAGGYFTVEMLNRLVVIRRDHRPRSEHPEEQQLRAWFQKRGETGHAFRSEGCPDRAPEEIRFQETGRWKVRANFKTVEKAGVNQNFVETARPTT